MKNKILLATSLVALFASLDANALSSVNWTGTEDLSAINAQILCNGADCVLSNIAAGDITGQININSVIGLNSFILSAENNNGDLTNISALIDSQGILQFNGFDGNNIELNGNITNTGTGYGVYLNSSYLSGNMLISGNISTLNDSAVYFKSSNINGDIVANGNISSVSKPGLFVDFSNVNGSLLINGNVSTTNDKGIFVENSIINGDMITNGDVSAKYSGILANYSSIYGDFITNGNVSVINDFGVYIDHVTVYGDFIANGTVSSGHVFGIDAEYSTINGDMIINGDVSAVNNAVTVMASHVNGNIFANGDISADNNALYLTGSNINGSLITNGSISTSGVGGINAETSTINGDIIINGDAHADVDYAIALMASHVNGNIITNGNITANNNSLFLAGSNISGDLITNGNISSVTDGGLYTDNMNINGDLITNGSISVGNVNGVYLYNSLINGDIITNGNISAVSSTGFSFDNSTTLGNLIANGDISGGVDVGFTVVGSRVDKSLIINGDVSAEDNALSIGYSTINKNIIINGDISGLYTNGFILNSSAINGDIINNGNISSSSSAVNVTSNLNLKGDFINNGKIIAGTINPDDTFNANGSRAVSFYYNNTLNKNFINTGIIAAASEGMWLEKTRIVGDIVNSGKILGGNIDFFGQETVGLYFVDSALMGKIQNTSTGIISGGYGITMSQDYKNGATGTYAAKNMTIENNGTIIGSLYDAIAFDITSADDIHGGTGLSYDNVLNYSGAGVLVSDHSNGNYFDIDMGAGTDVLNLNNVRGEWIATNGAETINISNYIVKSTYVNNSLQMNDHRDTRTTNFNISNMVFLVNTTGSYTAGSDLFVLKGAEAMTDADLANMSMQLEGYAGTDGYFFLDHGGVELKYHLNSLGVIGAHSDQAVAASDVPSITAANSSIVSAQNLNRSAMNMVSGRMMKLNNNKTFDTSGLWAQGFGEQSTYEGKIVNNSANSVGYDSDRYGMVIGYDKYLGSGVLAGLAVSYGLGDVNGDTDQFTTDIKQYQLNLYGSYNIENYFVDAQVGIGTTKYDQKRAYVGSEATAKYDSKSISAGLGAGYVWQAMEKLSVTPYTRFNYIKSNQDAYTESSNLRVDAVELTSEQASFGTEVAYNLLSSMGAKFQPRVFVEYARELGDDEIAINSQYTDNMAIGTTGYSPDLGNSIIRTGAGITMMGASNDYSVGLDYRYETRERYTSNGVMLNGKLFF